MNFCKYSGTAPEDLTQCYVIVFAGELCRQTTAIYSASSWQNSDKIATLLITRGFFREVIHNIGAILARVNLIFPMRDSDIVST